MKKFFVFTFFLFFGFFFADFALAGFGISPPRVENNWLVPGSHFEQTIMLSRGEAKEDLKITVEVEAPEIEKWIKFDKGKEFIFPAGKNQYPLIVMVDVPEDAGYSTYYGKLRIKASPLEAKGQVTVAIGVVADIKLRVSGEVFSDFKVRQVSIPDFEEGESLKFVVELENLGNVKVRPSKVKLEIWDNFHNQILKSGEITNFSWVESFKVGKSEGEMKVDLKSGQYWAEYEIYKDDELKTKDKIRFNVHLAGTLKPKPISKRISEFLFGSPLRIALSTFFATIILVLIFASIFYCWRKRKTKK